MEIVRSLVQTSMKTSFSRVVRPYRAAAFYTSVAGMMLGLVCHAAFAQAPQSSSTTKANAAVPPPPAPTFSVTTQSVTLVTNGTLYGTLEMPVSMTPVPVVLVLAGAIPIDRNGNSHLYPDSTNTIKLLANELAKQGVATLRYDKRGVAQSKWSLNDESDLTVEIYVNDAVAWGKKLLEDKRFSSLIVLGYAESSLVAMLAAKQLNADGFVCIAGTNRSMQDLMMEKARGNFPAPLIKQTEQIVALLERGKTTDSVPTILYPIFRPSVQPYMISMFRYQPAKEFAKLQMPILVTSGSKDYQVLPDESKSLAQANANAKFVVIEGMSGQLRDFALEQAKVQTKARYTVPIMPKLITELTTFIKSVKKRPRS
jgi:pimeloyl-ACP methyl ester carboxylesterase